MAQIPYRRPGDAGAVSFRLIQTRRAHTLAQYNFAADGWSADLTQSLGAALGGLSRSARRRPSPWISISATAVLNTPLTVDWRARSLTVMRGTSPEQSPRKVATSGSGFPGLFRSENWGSRIAVSSFFSPLWGEMVPPDRIELSTSALPRMRSTTELRRRSRVGRCAC